MIKTPQEMRALTHDLSTSAWTLSAIGALLESGLAEQLCEPRSVDALAERCTTLPAGHIGRCLAVAVEAGVVVADGALYRLAEGALPFAQAPGRTALKGEIRANLMQALAFLDSANGTGPAPGWRHTNAALLQAQGDASSMFPPMFKAHLLATLGDLGGRLEKPGARFLDVGVGVAALAIAMCQCWPELSVVGLDTFDVPLSIARQNVARAGLTARIELRDLAIEELRDETAFELAWLPSFFIPAGALAAAVARARASLRPGGWLIFPIAGAPSGDRFRAVFGLINELWGGPVLSTPDAEALLKAAGFSQVRVLPGPPTVGPLLAAQR